MSSSEEEARDVTQQGMEIRRRRPRRKRTLKRSPSYVVPKKNSLNWRSVDGTVTGISSCQDPRSKNDPKENDHQEEDVMDTMSDDGLVMCRSRDLSPVMTQMREYLSDADELFEEVLERLVNKAENASAAMVHNASEMVHRSKDAVKSGVHHASEMVHTNVNKASEMMHHGVHNASQMMHNGVHQASELVHTGVHHAEEIAKDVYERIRCWKACHFEKLPDWMRDNEHLHFGHRPELKSFAECFKSIFRIHTETGNIWTHLIGFVAFVIATIVFYVKPLCATCQLDIELSEKLIFLTFFIGAILCLACSTLFHTLCCHSEFVSTIFSRLDYAGIAFLIVGSIIPWLYYGFYCEPYAKISYMVAVILLGIMTIVLTMWDKFNQPGFRVYRAVVFVSLASASVVPCVHYTVQKGMEQSMREASMHWTLTMGALYLTGAFLYAARIPERFMPGKCDIWFQSHQIFHVLVIAAAFVHYHGISQMAMYRLKHATHCQQQWDSFDDAINHQSLPSGAPEISIGSIY